MAILRLLLIFAVMLGGPLVLQAQNPAAFPRETPSFAPVPKPDLQLPQRTNTNSPAVSKSKSSPPTASLWGTVAALGIMALGLFVAVRWLNRHGPPSLRGLPSEAVEPLGQRVLSRGVAVHLVRCGSRLLLLGVGPDGVRTLSEITDPVEVDLLTGACRRRDETSGAFSQVWQRTASATTSRPARNPAAFTSQALEVDGV